MHWPSTEKKRVWLPPRLSLAAWMILDKALHFSGLWWFDLLKSLRWPEVSATVLSHWGFLQRGAPWLYSNPRGALEIQTSMGPFLSLEGKSSRGDQDVSCQSLFRLRLGPRLHETGVSLTLATSQQKRTYWDHRVSWLEPPLSWHSVISCVHWRWWRWKYLTVHLSHISLATHSLITVGWWRFTGL